MIGAISGVAISPEEDRRRALYDGYMRELYNRTGTYSSSMPVKTEPYFIDLAHFREMQVNSGDDLLNALMGMMRIAGVDLTDCEKISIELDLERNRVQVSGTKQQKMRYEIPPQYRLTAAEIAQQQMQMADMLRPAQEEITRRMATVIDQQMINELIIHAPKKAPK